MATQYRKNSTDSAYSPQNTHMTLFLNLQREILKFIQKQKRHRMDKRAQGGNRTARDMAKPDLTLTGVLVT